MTDDKRNELVEVSTSLAYDVAKDFTKLKYLIKVDPDKIKNAFTYYEQIKDEVKNKITDDEFRQDRHKVASVVMFAIIYSTPLIPAKYPDSIKELEARRWINQMFAYSVAEHIVFSFLDMEDQTFILPENTADGRPYSDYLFGLIESMINTDNILYSQVNERVDEKANYITAISNALYLLERYTLDR